MAGTALKNKKREKAVGGSVVPFLDRVDEVTVLQNLDKNSTRQLIEKRLRFNRVEGKFEDQPLIPFTEDFVDFIYDSTMGNPRGVLERCEPVLDEGTRVKEPLLTLEFASKILEERGF